MVVELLPTPQQWTPQPLAWCHPHRSVPLHRRPNDELLASAVLPGHLAGAATISRSCSYEIVRGRPYTHEMDARDLYSESRLDLDRLRILNESLLAARTDELSRSLKKGLLAVIASPPEEDFFGSIV